MALLVFYYYYESDYNVCCPVAFIGPPAAGGIPYAGGYAIGLKFL